MPPRQINTVQNLSNVPVLTELALPETGIFRLPEGSVSCTFQASDHHTRGLVVRLPDGHGAVFCHLVWGENNNGLIDEHGVLHTSFYVDEVDLFDNIPLPKGNTPEERSAALSDIFWNKLNPRLDDPYLDSDALENKGLYFRNGNQEEFEQVIRWAAACLPSNKIQEPLKLLFYAESANEPAELSHDDLPEGLYLLEQIAKIALNHFGPMGESWEYNDGAYGRQSGYTNYRASFTVYVDPPSAHQRIEARAALAAWLRNTAKMDPKNIADLLGI